jgi:uncharacterized glyoxalase superfamily protein PhnB
MARIWHGGLCSPDASARPVVLGFSPPSRDALDQRYRELNAAGYTGRQEPCDAFLGACGGVLGDPAGTDIGLMSPIDL